jgi:chromosome segregation ATPase
MSGEVGVPDQDAIEQELEELLRFNETLMRENELFESHLQRTNPHLLDDEEESAKGRKKPQKRSQQMLLTAEQKYDIAVQEMEEVREEILQTRQSSEQLMDSLRSRMEECDVRIAEIKKDAYEFKRDIVTGAENFRTGKIVAEKAVRYMEEKLRAKAAVAEKLRLKNATLKQQYTKVEASLQQKEDMGEVLHVIDFDQLKIENQQYLEKIEDRNNELLRLKLTTGNTVQVLNTLKHKLHNLTAESEWLKRETTTRKESLAKISEEIARVEQEKEQAARLHRKLAREENVESNMPQVLDYVQQKAEQFELERSLTAWQRKVDIAEMEHKRYSGIARKGGLVG